MIFSNLSNKLTLSVLRNLASMSGICLFEMGYPRGNMLTRSEEGRCFSTSECAPLGGSSWKQAIIIEDGVRNWRGSDNDDEGDRQIAVCIGKRDLDEESTFRREGAVIMYTHYYRHRFVPKLVHDK